MPRKSAYNTNEYLRKIRKKTGLEKQHTFISDKKLSMGIQMLKKGDKYGEPAHRNGEVYFALKGHAKLRIRRKEFKVSPGMAIYVPPMAKHEFYDVKKEFVFLFIFAGLDI